MTEPRRALEGIRVLELAQVVAGDDLRRIGPSEDGHSYWFAVDNRNPRSRRRDANLSAR